MPGDGSQDLVVAGRRLRKKLVVALTLSSAVPLLVLAYVVRAFVLPSRAAGDSLVFGGVQALVAFTVIGMIAGAYIIWDVGRTVARIAEMLASERAIAGLGRRKDEVGTLMTSFNRMLETIEQQAAEINSFASRLDAAYRELESTNTRLKETSFKDEVTGLYNRRFFSIRLEEEMQRHRRFNHPVSVVLMDLDGFKAVNDDLGQAVDDDIQVREVLHQIFLSAGYRCLLAADGPAGLGIFRASHPPLTVTDLKMPGLDGIAVLGAIREMDPDAAVMVLTGAPDVKTAID